ncbi:MAG: molybdopterin-dependent oxidoreductase [Planctomycetaceae bacterium]|nr:molybdopterin-dependent oxidoreductase [Planctomycetaceae bacterium]
MTQPKRSLIERIATSLKIIPELDNQNLAYGPQEMQPVDLQRFPPMEQWDDWFEYDPHAWPVREKKNYAIVPTTCFNCESACGLVGYVDKETMEVRKFEGNPYHPGSRGRNCAKGPATINQIKDTDRILYPLKRDGARGSGKWKRISWDQVISEIGDRIGNALHEERHNEVVYHVGRPGHEGYTNRVLKAWGVDGHNSHTNICSAGARFGYALWHGYDRPSPDHANARFILLVSAHLESGHYFNPHAQRIIEGMMDGAELAVLDPRLSNTASAADYWMPTQPGSEAAVLLAIAAEILRDGTYNESWMKQWVNWRDYLTARGHAGPHEFSQFIDALKQEYAEYTPEFAEQESGVSAQMVRQVAKRIGAAGDRLATHNWRSASSGNLGGWAVSRTLHFLNVLTGSVGTVGGTSPSGWNKFKPKFFDDPPAVKFWNQMHFPNEYPLAHYELSFLLPHFLKEGRGKIDTYFTRVFNPVWSYPDGFSWIDVLSDEEKIGCHIAMTPTWNETAYFADYVLPMGHASERHDLNSYETHSGLWIAFRQPILREAARRAGKEVEFTYEVNPGEVWEEDEFWLELSWAIDKNNDLGIREHFISPYREGEKITIDEYYRYIFEKTPGLKAKAAEHDLDPLEYMRRYGAFEVEKKSYAKHLQEIPQDELQGAQTDEDTGSVSQNGEVIGVSIDGIPRRGFLTPSKKQEFFSQTMTDWGWPEFEIPTYIKSHVHPENIDPNKNEFVLLPTYRLPTLIHSRSGNAKWLAEISNQNPVWIHTSDANTLGVVTGDLVRITTEIGFFVDRIWVTEAIKPGIVACSHHLGRWRREQDPKANRWASNTVEINKSDDGVWSMRRKGNIEGYQSGDADSSRIFWSDGGVHQNLTFPVHPDPISGMHCWHQKVTVTKAHDDDRHGDVEVDTKKSMAVYRKWLEMTRPAPGPNGLRRPLWMNRPLRPETELFYIKSDAP